MSHVEIALFLKAALLLWLLSLALVVGIQVLRGDIKTSGMLRSKGGTSIDPERVAMLLVTVLVIGGYAFTALSGELTLNEQTKAYQLPDAPDILLVLLAGGNTTYLAGKLSRR